MMGRYGKPARIVDTFTRNNVVRINKHTGPDPVATNLGESTRMSQHQ